MVDYGWANLSATCFECDAVTLIRNFGRGSRDLNCSKCFLRQHVGTHQAYFYDILCERDADLVLEVGVRSVELTKVLAVRFNAVPI